MPKPQPMYSDRDYLEARFSSVDEKLDTLIDTLTKQDQRIERLETDIEGAKLLGKAAMGVAVVMGGIITWATDLLSKASHLTR